MDGCRRLGKISEFRVALIHKLENTIKSIDGSDLSANNKLIDEGYDITNTHTYTTPYASFLTNYNYGIVENIIISKKYNERKYSNELIRIANDKNVIYSEDAGYFSHKHAFNIHKCGNFFINKTSYR